MFNFLKLQIKKIEDEIGLGQIEELIEMAKDELHLVDYYIGIIFLYQSNNIYKYPLYLFQDSRGWELVKEAKSQADFLLEELADSIYFSSPEERPPPPAAPGASAASAAPAAPKK
jgi:hypothetical protein